MFGRESQFWMAGIHATNLKEVTDDASKLDDGSFWAVMKTFEGTATFARFADVERNDFPQQDWDRLTKPWISSHDQMDYMAYVSTIRSAIAEGGVYQVNACRQLHQTMDRKNQSLAGLFSQLLIGNPAPFAAYLSVKSLEIASASPERFLSRTGSTILTSPIKGTIKRNDLGRVCTPGSVEVAELFRHEKHPGITHLVSDVKGELKSGLGWRDIFDATMPPGSVSGAPKSAALRMIEENERVRGPYCGALGWVHGDRAELAVAIRTFWSAGDSIVRFGTGAGITWGSDPASEWEETQLKARHLISIAGGQL